MSEKKKGQKFTELVDSLKEAYPNDEDFPSVLASSSLDSLSSYTYYCVDTLSNVEQFHELFECPIGAEPHIPEGPHTLRLAQVKNHLMDLRSYLREVSKEDVRCLRAALIIEEVAELFEAMAERNLVKTLDALGDMDYIDKGTAITFGLHGVYYEACSRIHESNLTKLVDGKPVKDASGKVTKGPNYKQVDLTDLVK